MSAHPETRGVIGSLGTRPAEQDCFTFSSESVLKEFQKGGSTILVQNDYSIKNKSDTELDNILNTGHDFAGVL